MKNVFSILIISISHFCISHAQNVERLSALRQTGSMMYTQNGDPYTGKVFDFFGDKVDKTKIKFEGNYKDGKPFGHVKKWYQNHKLESNENYLAGGIKDGYQLYYYEKGSPRDSSYFENGQPEGKHRKWHLNGKKESEESYINGILDGKSLTYDENGKLILEKNYLLGRIASEISWNSKGNKADEKTYLRGLPNGKWSNYNENGQLLSEEVYQQGEIINRLIITRYPDGKKESEKVYVKKFPSGIWKTYDSNEQLTAEIEYQNGKISSEKYFLNNQPNGTWKKNNANFIGTITYQNGKKIAENSMYADGVPNGLQREYSEDGRVKEIMYENHGEKIWEGGKLNNKKDGKWLTWSDHGEKLTEETYKDDVLQGSTVKIISNLVGFHRTNSLLFKLKDAKTFIRFEFKSYALTNDGSNTSKVALSIKNNLNYLSGLTPITADGEYKDEIINYIIELNNINVSFESFTGPDIRYTNSGNRSGYSATVVVTYNIIGSDNLLIESKSTKNTTKHLLFSIPYETEDEALTVANEKGYVGKAIEKYISIK